MRSRSDVTTVEIDPPTPEATKLWKKALELADAFGADESWCLIGGLMVQLHALEHGATIRPTGDIDLLGDSRRRPPMTERIAETLVERGGEMATPPPGDDRLGFRFEIDGQVVEVLGPEGLRADPATLGKHSTFQTPGGTQALRRAETVDVVLRGGPSARLRRPSLLGAILLKARVVAKRRPHKFASDRQDLLDLLTFIEDPRVSARELKRTERSWLCKVESPLFDDPEQSQALAPVELARAEQAYRLLIA
jgi:hypothetical protein